MKKAKRLTALFLLLAMALMMVACGGTADAPAATDGGDAPASSAAAGGDGGDGTLEIGFSLPSLNFPFYVRMYDTIIEECDARGWNYQFVDGNLDSGTQLNGCNDLLNKGIDVMVMATWWIDAMQDIFDQCESAGIQVYLMDNMVIPDAAKNGITCTTGTDNYNAGFVGGTWMAEQLAAEGKDSVKLITVGSTSEQQMKRRYGFADALEANGITVDLLQEYEAGERPKAMTVIEDALTTYTEIDIIYGASAQDSLGAYDACEAANRKEITVFGFDGEDDEIKLIDEGTQYIASITQDPVGMARLVAENIQKHYFDGEAIDQVIETPAGVYGPEGQVEGADILEGKPQPNPS